VDFRSDMQIILILGSNIIQRQFRFGLLRRHVWVMIAQTPLFRVIIEQLISRSKEHGKQVRE